MGKNKAEEPMPSPGFPIVGIGASAGGLAAFEAFFSAMPADEASPMAFVLVQHLAPDHKSILTDLISRYTSMEVTEVEDGITVKPNCAYIIPPNKDMALLNGALHLLEPALPRGQRMLKKSGDCFHARLDAIFAADGEGERFCKVLVSDISERVLADEQIKSLIEEKELLLREVHHRVKNNLNNIIALLQLQEDTLSNKKAADALNDAENRIKSMVILYDVLNHTNDILAISIRDYLVSMVEKVIEVFSNRENIHLDLRIEDIRITVQEMYAVGIIMNELITNAMKHAFSGKKQGVLHISVARTGERISITVSDDGPGLPGYVCGGGIGSISGAGLGLKLVAMLVTQISGELSVECGDGTRFILEFTPEPL